MPVCQEAMALKGPAQSCKLKAQRRIEYISDPLKIVPPWGSRRVEDLTSTFDIQLLSQSKHLRANILRLGQRVIKHPMPTKPIHTVTGAFGYSGKYIAQRLLDKGHTVQTITNSVNRQNLFGEEITVSAFNFDNPEKLTQSLQETEVLYNTYWVRFNHKNFTFVDVRDALD